MLVANVASRRRCSGSAATGSTPAQMQVGALTAYLSYLMQIVMSVMMATFMMMMIPRSAVCADRIMEVLRHRRPRCRTARRRRSPTCPQRGTLELDGVEFSYPGAERAGAPRPLLPGAARPDRRGHRLDRRRQEHPGQPGAAAVRRHRRRRSRVGGVDVRRLEPERLWSVIGLVPQKAYLFSGTVALQPAATASPTRPTRSSGQALEIAQAATSSATMPEGLDAPIAQGGTNVSGGQRQRLAIARAVVRRPEIYLFDDSFSALDLATDARLRAALRPVTRDATVLIVAQRVSTIRDADLILVLEDGVVVGRGTHHELLDDLRDLPGDRRLPAERGGGGMSRPTPARPAKAPPSDSRPAARRPSAIQAGPGGPGRGPIGGGMVGQKANDFGPSAKRLVAPDGARDGQGDRASSLLAVASVGLMSLGPRILGRATDLIFAGLSSAAASPQAGAHPGSRPSTACAQQRRRQAGRR